MEESRLPLTKWVHAFWRVCASKKGVSALQIKRELDVAYPTALFLLNRVRLAMSDWGLGVIKRLGGQNKTVEADETYVGGKPRYKGQSKPGRGTRKTAVFVAVERGGGTRLQIVERVSANCLGAAMRQHVDEASRLMTDEWSSYTPIGVRFEGGHEVVVHSKKEYVRKEDRTIHSNTAESVFALLKRGLSATFHSISKKAPPEIPLGVRVQGNHRTAATPNARRGPCGRRWGGGCLQTAPARGPGAPTPSSGRSGGNRKKIASGRRTGDGGSAPLGRHLRGETDAPDRRRRDSRSRHPRTRCGACRTSTSIRRRLRHRRTGATVG